MKLPNLDNITLLSDSYKIPHWKMMSENTENVYSYGESRIGAKYLYTQWMGLQMILKKHFVGKHVTKECVKEGEEFSRQHFGMDGLFNSDLWNHIVDKHDGRLPIKIRAVKEGVAIPVGNPLISVQITDEQLKNVRGLTNHFETILTHTWYPSNVATIGFHMKLALIPLFTKSSDSNNAENALVEMHDRSMFSLHDFGFRGATCVEAAGIGGAAHLVNFRGSDTVIGIQYGRYYYNTDEMLGFSVPASEHSIKTAFGVEGEQKITKHLLETFPNGILSDVQDSYDIEASIHYIGQNFKKEILNRNGKYVFRPDSPRFKGDTPKDQILWIVETLAGYFGYTTNSKGYKVLNPKVGVIYGDGLSFQEIVDSATYLVDKGWSVENAVYGMGGGLLQKHSRDTQRNAFKSSAQKRSGEWKDVSKNPKDASKKSKKGKVETFIDEEGKYFSDLAGSENGDSVFVDIFENGELLTEFTFGELRKNADSSLFSLL